jgi:hypothetical protein
MVIGETVGRRCTGASVGSQASPSGRGGGVPHPVAEEGDPWQGISAVYIFEGRAATHFVDVGDTIECGVASLEEHRAYIDGLGEDFDPDRFLGDMGGYGGMLAGCEYAVLLQSFSV